MIDKFRPEDLESIPCAQCGQALLMPDGSMYCGVTMKPTFEVCVEFIEGGFKVCKVEFTPIPKKIKKARRKR